MKHTIALAALVATSMGFVAVPAFAQNAAPAATEDATPAAPPQAAPVPARADRQFHRSLRDGGRNMRGGVLGVVCSDNGAEALEIALVRLSHRLDLTDAQKTLFDTFRATALTTQTGFADDCKAATPATTADTSPDLLERLKAGLALEQARLTAVSAVLPDFEAFYGSLTDVQKADLMPRRAMRMDRQDRDRGHDRDAPGRSLRLPAPGRG